MPVVPIGYVSPSSDHIWTVSDRHDGNCLVDIDDFLAEEIQGPADFVCTADKKCTFEGKTLSLGARNWAKS